MVSARSGIADGTTDGGTENIPNHLPKEPADNRNLANANLAGSAPSTPARYPSRRKISPASGRALECLGHAIEYLTDEYCLGLGRVGLLEPSDPRIEAIQLLMTLNRQIYYSCPEVEPAYRRLARWIFRLPEIPAAEAPSKQPLH